MDSLTSSAPEGASDDSTSPLITVCIAAMPDGTYQVSQLDADGDQDDMGGQDMGGGDSGAYPESGAGTQTAQSIDEALNIAGQMLQEEAGEDSGGEQENPNAPAKDPRAIWDQLAKKSDKARGLS